MNSWFPYLLINTYLCIWLIKFSWEQDLFGSVHQDDIWSFFIESLMNALDRTTGGGRPLPLLRGEELWELGEDTSSYRYISLLNL